MNGCGIAQSLQHIRKDLNYTFDTLLGQSVWEQAISLWRLKKISSARSVRKSPQKKKRENNLQCFSKFSIVHQKLRPIHKHIISYYKGNTRAPAEPRSEYTFVRNWLKNRIDIH